MQIVGHGIDAVSVIRMRALLAAPDSHFESRVFSAAERDYCRKKKDPIPHFAARFAAKEAYGKALGLGLGASGDLGQIQVTQSEKGAPLLALEGRAQEIFLSQGGGNLFLSLSHDGDYAIASVILSR